MHVGGQLRIPSLQRVEQGVRREERARNPKEMCVAGAHIPHAGLGPAQSSDLERNKVGQRRFP